LVLSSFSLGLWDNLQITAIAVYYNDHLLRHELGSVPHHQEQSQESAGVHNKKTFQDWNHQMHQIGFLL
jgi:hypothetical protein